VGLGHPRGEAKGGEGPAKPAFHEGLGQLLAYMRLGPGAWF
jgi:hypothetical protein